MAGIFQSGVLRERFAVGEIRDTTLNEICPEAREKFPFYFALPYSDPVALFAWRVYVRFRCIRDLEFRRVVWEMCRRDVAFFAVTFGFIFEPRPLPRRLPFHLWTDQVTLLCWFEEIFGKRPAGVNKTRGIGLSWLAALFLFHKWLFVTEVKIGVLTKDKDLLDGPDCNSLLGKFQYLFDNLPEWAKYTPSGNSKLARLIKTTSFINVSTKAVIQGFVSTSAKLRQLRFTIIFADEYAYYERSDQEEWLVSAGGCTNCLLMVSTWNGFEDAFHRLMYEEESSLLRINAMWWNNYERWQGAYKMESGRVVFVDQAYQHPDGYQYGIPDYLQEGYIRSPWVDAELSMPGINRLKALRDIYGMSVCEQTNNFFSSEMRQALKVSLRDPDVLGLLDLSKGKVEILPTLKGDVRLWGGVPLRDRGPYTAFADLSQGVGQAFCVLSVFDRGGEQILEYGTNVVSTVQFAFNCVMLARWLADKQGDGWVVMDFEANGQQSKPFAAELLRVQYGNIHKSDIRSNTVRRLGEVPTYYGTCNRDGGLANFRELERAVLSMDCILRSSRIADDLRRCGKDEDGRPSFAVTREGHGDFAHAAGGGWWRSRTNASLDARAEIETDNARVKQPTVELFAIPENRLWSSEWT
jgi:hypothetical protein